MSSTVRTLGMNSCPRGPAHLLLVVTEILCTVCVCVRACVTMLLKIWENVGPKWCSVIFDSLKMSFSALYQMLCRLVGRKTREEFVGVVLSIPWYHPAANLCAHVVSTFYNAVAIVPHGTCFPWNGFKWAGLFPRFWLQHALPATRWHMERCACIFALMLLFSQLTVGRGVLSVHPHTACDN